jgi:hypothetical protein
MYNPVKYTYVEYHSTEWDRLVESGWKTHSVEEMADGTRIAKMIYQSVGWYR